MTHINFLIHRLLVSEIQTDRQDEFLIDIYIYIYIYINLLQDVKTCRTQVSCLRTPQLQNK